MDEVAIAWLTIEAPARALTIVTMVSALVTFGPIERSSQVMRAFASDTEHRHPVPVPPIAERPAGKLSLTTTSVAEEGPPLATSMV